ncbi:hypothetical protein HAX54_033124, partial [Datura stramonium]|nr:hypothetical protein [Datura stramonium]
TEHIEDEVYLLKDKREVVVETYGVGFHPCHHKASQSSWGQGHGNHGRNFEIWIIEIGKSLSIQTSKSCLK